MKKQNSLMKLHITRRVFLQKAATGTAMLAGLASSIAAAPKTRIRLGTLAPKDTSFHKSLLQMGERWKKASQGSVALTIYTDGTMGGEVDMIRRMRLGQLQAAMLTVNGLMQIEDSISGLQNMPMVFRSLEEYDHVRDKLSKMLEQRFLEKGFIFLFWGDAGWITFFSKKPAIRPDDFKPMKMFVGSGDSKSMEVMRAVGITPVPLEYTDTLAGLQTGLIDSLPTVPIYALNGQFYGPAPHMLAVKWAPLVGGTVITTKAWNSIPDSIKEECKKAAFDAGQQIKARSRQEADESVEAMKKRGLIVHTLTPELEAEWQQFAEKVYPQLRGKIVPEDIMDQVLSILKEYREQKNK
jgi:TRAP-type C4-dicarboxylate transport system substrate-binding protein